MAKEPVPPPAGAVKPEPSPAPPPRRGIAAVFPPLGEVPGQVPAFLRFEEAEEALGGIDRDLARVRADLARLRSRPYRGGFYQPHPLGEEGETLILRLEDGLQIDCLVTDSGPDVLLGTVKASNDPARAPEGAAVRITRKGRC